MTPPPEHPTPARRPALVAGLGAGAVATVAVALVPAPWVAFPLLLALVVLLPTARRADRRLALNLALLVGWVPLAATVPPLLGAETAAAAVLGLGTAATVGVGVHRRRVPTPEWHRRDLVVALAGVLAALVALPLRSPGSPGRALSMVTTGIDHGFHFSMFLGRRLVAGGSPLVEQMDDSGFTSYPKGFHNLLTVLAQTLFGDPGTPAVELERYATTSWLVFVVLGVLVTAAFLSALPDAVPARLLVPAVAVVWSLVLGVPGSLNLLQGHLSFLLAACAITVAALLTVSAERVTPLTLVVVLGLVLAATSWTLLLPFAGVVAAYPALVTWSRQRAAVRWGLVAVAGVLLLGVAAVLGPLVASPAIQDLVRDGAIPRVRLWVLVLLTVGPLVLHLVLRRRRGAVVPVFPVLPVLVAGIGQLAVLAAYMLASTGELTYYFWKLGLATLLVVLPVSARLVVTTAVTPQPRPSTLRARVAALVVALVAAAGLGSALQELAAPSVGWAAIIPVELANRPGSDEVGDVGTVLRLAADTPPEDAERTTLVATRPGDMRAGHASVWFHALSLSTSARAMSTNDPLYDLGEDRTDTAVVVAVARQALAAPDALVVVTDPAARTAILDVLGDGVADRVVVRTS